MTVLCLYVCFTRFGISSLFIILGSILVIEFVLKTVADVSFFVSSRACLTNKVFLDKEKKLKRTYHSLISTTVVTLYLVFLCGSLTLFSSLVVIDMRDLQRDSMGLIPMDKMKQVMDLSLYEKELTQSFDLIENNFNITIPKSLIKNEQNETRPLKDMISASIQSVKQIDEFSPLMNDYESYIDFNIVYKLVQFVMTFTAISLTNLVGWCFAISNYLFMIFLYFSFVYWMVDAPTSTIDLLLSFLPKEGELKPILKQKLKTKITGVFSYNLKSAVYQIVYTWILLDMLKLKYMFLYCVTGAFFRTLPFVSTLLVGVLAALQGFFLQQIDITIIVLFFAVYVWVD